MDIELRNGDLYISQSGDITLTDSIIQKIHIKILWILGEWKWNKEEGIDYFGYVLMKNPDIEMIEGIIREKIFEIEEVVDVLEIEVKVDKKNRRGTISYVVSTEEEKVRGEVAINGKIWSNG